MKNYIKIFTLAAGLATFTACDESYLEYDALVPHSIDCILNMKDAGEKNAVLYTANGVNTISFEVLKTGARANKAARMSMRVLSDKEVNQKYAAKLVPYYVIPYQLEGSTGNTVDVEMAADETYKLVNIKVDPTAVSLFIDEKQEANPEKASQMQFVLPVQIYSETDSVSAINNYKCLTITNVAFPAPDQLYLIQPDGSSLKFDETEDNVYSINFDHPSQYVEFGSGDYFLCDQSSHSDNANYYRIDASGKLKLGSRENALQMAKEPYASLTLDFNQSTANLKYVKKFSYYCSVTGKTEFDLRYIGNHMWQGTGWVIKQDPNGWGWSDERYKFILEFSDGSKQHWGAEGGSKDLPANRSTENGSDSYYNMELTTNEGQWDPTWKLHNDFHGGKDVSITLNFSRIPAFHYMTEAK